MALSWSVLQRFVTSATMDSTVAQLTLRLVSMVIRSTPAAAAGGRKLRGPGFFE